MKHEYLRIEIPSENKTVFQCLVYEKEHSLKDVAECSDLLSLKEWRHENYPQSQRTYSHKVNAIVDAWVGDNVYQDIVVLREVPDVRAACGTPDFERPDWNGPGFEGLSLQEDGCELIHAWTDICHQKS